MNTSRKMAAGFLALTLLVAACGADDDGGGSTTEPDAGADGDATTVPDEPSDEPSDDAVATTDQPPAPSEETRGTLRVAYHFDSPIGFDPHRHASGADNVRSGLVYDYLLLRTADGIEPALATGWEWNDDGTALELELRDGVEFHDGAVFDAHAAKASLDRAMTLEGSTAAPWLATVESIEVVDDLRVRLNTSGPDALLVGALAWPGSAGAMISPNALDDPDLSRNPVGAGRFRLVDWQEGVGSSFERWDGYWDADSVHLDHLEITVMADASARLNALRTGAVDLALLEPSQIDEITAVDGYVVDAGPGLNLEALLLNRSKAGLDDSRVRQALNYAVDRDAMVNGLHFGYAAPTAQWYGQGLDGHVPEADEVYTYDPDRARELLADAGIDELVLEVLVPSLPTTLALAEALQQQMEAAGISLDIRQIDIAQSGALFYGEQQGDALIASPFPVAEEPLQTAQIFLLPTSVVGNPGGHSTEEWQTLIEAALATLDEAERRQIVDEVMLENVVLASNVIISAPYQGWAMTDDVEGFIRPATYPDFRGVRVRAD